MGNYIDADDIDNWPSGTTEAEQTAAINYVEQLIEKIIGRHFYSKAFDIKINGNNKNRLFLPLYADILTVTKIWVGGIEMDSSWFTFDENSVFIDLTSSGSGVGDPELLYKLTTVEAVGIFPRGFNNIRIKGTYGDSAVPQPIKELCIILVRYDNDNTLYTSTVLASEKIGDYAYKIGDEFYKKNKIYTGIFEADKIIAAYKRQKKLVIMAA